MKRFARYKIVLTAKMSMDLTILFQLMFYKLQDPNFMVHTARGLTRYARLLNLYNILNIIKLILTRHSYVFLTRCSRCNLSRPFGVHDIPDGPTSEGVDTVDDGSELPGYNTLSRPMAYRPERPTYPVPG